MTESQVIAMGRDALITVLMVGGPMIAMGLAVGLLVSLFQATTQIHEQTLAFVPKIVAVLVGGLIFGPWMLRTMVEYAEGLFAAAHLFVR